MDENENEWTRNPAEACRRFLEEMGTSTHIIQQDFGTMILTKMGRDELGDYLHRLWEQIASDPNRRDDLVHVQVEELPNGDSRMAAILKVEVS